MGISLVGHKDYVATGRRKVLIIPSVSTMMLQVIIRHDDIARYGEEKAKEGIFDTVEACSIILGPEEQLELYNYLKERLGK